MSVFLKLRRSDGTVCGHFENKFAAADYVVVVYVGLGVGDAVEPIFLEPGGRGEAPGELSGIRVKDCSFAGVLSPFCVTLRDGHHCKDITIEAVVRN